MTWANDQELARAEMSDLLRAEARRLMLRRGIDPLVKDQGLDDRLRDFVSRSASFAIPNKKAAYELTHTVFYLSEYGRKDPGLDDEVRQSLDFAGTLAFLDLNADLLAEICIATRYAGTAPPAIWEEWLVAHTRGFEVESGDALSVQDDYHEFFVCNWLMAVSGADAFAKGFTPGRMQFRRPYSGTAPLRGMSECLFEMDTRHADWSTMRHHVVDSLSEEAQEFLLRAETASSDFEAFFAGFVRAGRAESGLMSRPTATIPSVRGRGCDCTCLSCREPCGGLHRVDCLGRWYDQGPGDGLCGATDVCLIRRSGGFPVPNQRAP
ncbi:hypothetical protein RXV86_20590 [Alisedimentitalea sp. MJ-SS2]|uniref:DUF6902 family protein n=1 Tax=Aliisedimentitalea sp. MJ-SS2 TaxID=3049795 RepID=UPI00290EE50F|nr:hypothetical protein [Alisedimentitalea sp. MJ-SS2]MDU8929792.1 hypothetical protein [Alisedimentitalea sp. MJ-SS2]